MRKGLSFQTATVYTVILSSLFCPEIFFKMCDALKNVPEVQAVADGNSLFAGALNGALKASNPGNLIFSPFSVSAVVAMAKLGARGVTAQEIEAAFKFPQCDNVLSQGYSKILKSLQESNEGYTLAAANRLYSQQGFNLKSDFSEGIRNAFGAEVQQLNFGESAAAAAEINSWVEKTTNSKIKDLISPDSLNALTRVVLVNGVYFKGLWKDKFNPEHTQKAPFHLNENDKVEVDMMFKKSKFPFGIIDALDAQVVALPYKGDRLSMIIYVPQQVNGLSKIEEGLKSLKPSQILEQMGSRSDVEVYLPRFKIESTLALVQPLKNLGVTKMFSECADFSGIPESEVGLYVSEVVQKAFIEVNEEGSEAAAATGMVMMMRCLPMSFEVRADRPFYFQILDQATNLVLFAGAIANPTA